MPPRYRRRGELDPRRISFRSACPTFDPIDGAVDGLGTPLLDLGGQTFQPHRRGREVLFLAGILDVRGVALDHHGQLFQRGAYFVRHDLRLFDSSVVPVALHLEPLADVAEELLGMNPAAGRLLLGAAQFSADQQALVRGQR